MDSFAFKGSFDSTLVSWGASKGVVFWMLLHLLGALVLT